MALADLLRPFLHDADKPNIGEMLQAVVDGCANGLLAASLIDGTNERVICSSSIRLLRRASSASLATEMSR